MLRCVRDRDARLGGDVLDRARPLREQVEEFEPVTVR
jgi:hypothetical protein